MLVADVSRRQMERQDSAGIPLETGKMAEYAGKCYFKGAFQADNSQEFQRRMQLSRSTFTEAASYYDRANEVPLSKKTKAEEFFSHYWIHQNAQERRNAIEECIRLAREAETRFESVKDARGLAETHLDLLAYLRESFYLSKSREVLQRNFTEVLRIGRVAIKEFEELGDDEGLFESLHQTFWMLAVEAQPILPSPDFDALALEAKDLGNRIREISSKGRTSHERSISLLIAGSIASIYEGDFEKALVLFKEGVEATKEHSDTLTSGLILWQAAYYTLWSGTSRDNTEERRAVLREAWHLASNSSRKLGISSPAAFLTVVYTLQADICLESALVARDPQEKRAHLHKAVQVASVGARLEDHTWAWKLAAHTLAKATYFLALSEVDLSEKTRLLREAMGIRRELGTITDQLLPTVSWDKCVELNYLALVKKELSFVEQDPGKKVQLLEEAASDMSRCLLIGKDWAMSSTYFTQNL